MFIKLTTGKELSITKRDGSTEEKVCSGQQSDSVHVLAIEREAPRTKRVFTMCLPVLTLGEVLEQRSLFRESQDQGVQWERINRGIVTLRAILAEGTDGKPSGKISYGKVGRTKSDATLVIASSTGYQRTSQLRGAEMYDDSSMEAFEASCYPTHEPSDGK